MRRLGTVLAIVGVLSLAAPPPAEAAATILLSAYVGSPAPEHCTSWLDVSSEKDLGVQVSDLSGSDGVGIVSVQGQVSSRMGPYVMGTCEDPPDKDVATDRCYFNQARMNRIRVCVTAYTSGTFQVELESHSN